MKTMELNVQKRQNMTKNELNRFRKNGNIPAILYGKHLKENVSLSMDASTFTKILKNNGRTVLFDFVSNDSELNKKSALIKDLQQDCITDNIVHVDLVEIKQDELVSVNVKLNFVGVPTGVKNSGGVLEVARRTVNVECLPAFIPNSIDIDISGLDIGQALHISDLKAGEGITILDAQNITLASVNIPKVVKAVEETPLEGEASAEAATGEAKAEPQAETKEKAEDKPKK